MIEFSAFGPLLASAGLMLVMFAVFGCGSKACRAIAAVLCIFLTLRYLWRQATLGIPKGETLPQQAWARTFFLFESTANLSSIIVFFFLSRTKDRSADADAAQNSPLLAAPGEVFIVTCNEPESVLERTIAGAMAIDHPDLRVFVLDDGARGFVREIAHDLGAHYVSRIKGKQAKAGNVNNAIAFALSAGRRPEFILLLDADFVPGVNILKRTLGLFAEPDVGIVPPPQPFFDPDPIQANLLCASAWPDEQRFFFDIPMPAMDAWGAAFCCGTSAAFRIASLLATEGMATETVTEDKLTSFKTQEHGYRTIYLNEPLGMGLAPKGLQAYITRRCRWRLGAIQQIHTRWSFARAARLRPASRLSSFAGALYCIFTFPFKILMVTAPMVFWWTGTAVIAATAGGQIYWLAPSAVGGIIFMCFHGRNRVLLRRALTARLFTGAYRGTIDDIEVPQALFALGKRLLRWKRFKPPGSRFAATGDCRTNPAAGSCGRGAAKTECHPVSGTLAPAPDQIPRVFAETAILLIRGRRRYGKIGHIASPRGSILSRTKVYCLAKASGLKQLFLGIAYGVR